MTNSGSRRNTGNYVVKVGICTTLPTDLSKVDIVNDWSIKIQSKMEGNKHHSSETSSENPTTLQEAKDLLPHDDQWTISNMWSQDQGKAIANAIQLGNATGISDGSYKNNRGIAACVMGENNNDDSRIYTVHDTP